MSGRLMSLPCLGVAIASATLMVSLTWSDTCQGQEPKLPKVTPKVTPVPPSRTTPPRTTTSTSRRIPSTTKTPATAIPKAQEIAIAKAAYMLLASASSTYHGHKTRALSHVRSALSQLDRASMGQMQPTIVAMQSRQALLGSVITASGADLGGAVSDAMVYNASYLLGQLEPLLSANNQRSILMPVERARTEVAAALEFSAAEALKGREADVLTGAYVLLAAANHDYDGHRPRAMRHVEVACNILEADLLTRGSVQKQINALKDANAKTLVKYASQTDAAVHETQALSDAQLLLADVLIQRVAFFLNPTRQRHVLSRLADADREIGLALLIR